MLIIFPTHFSHLVIPVEKNFIWPDFAIQVSFIVNIFVKSILDIGKYNLVMNYLFLTSEKFHPEPYKFKTQL